MTDCDRFAQILDTFKSLRLPDARSAIEKNQPRSLFPFFSYLFLFSFHSIRIVRFVLDTDDFRPGPVNPDGPPMLLDPPN